MKLLLCLIVSSILFITFENFFRKRPYCIYLGAILIGLMSGLLPNSIASIINRGTLATSLFIIVMYARILPPKSKFYKTFMILRAPIAIAASFLIFIHNGKTLFNYINAYRLVGAVLKPHEIAAAICSGIMFILLVPLTITSFKVVRKRMNPKKWKTLQKLSYIFYALIYVHVSCLFIYHILNGRTNYCLELFIYTVIFGFYLFRRVGIYLSTKPYKAFSGTFVKMGYALVGVISIGIFSLQYIPPKEEPYIIANEVSIDVAAPVFSDGEYFGEALGYNGPVSVKLYISEGKISDLKYIDYTDEDEYFLPAWESISSQVISGCSIDNIDTVSGATYSSRGIINAINQALYQ